VKVEKSSLKPVYSQSLLLGMNISMISSISLDDYIITKKTESKYTEKDEIASSLPDMELYPLSESRKRSLVRHTVSLVRNRTLL
jgi:hypothetical protein